LSITTSDDGIRVERSKWTAIGGIGPDPIVNAGAKRVPLRRVCLVAGDDDETAAA
jgi:hypothetical protein